MFFDYCGNKIYYHQYDFSALKNPQTIVFLHGWGSDSSVFFTICETLSRSFRCVLVDFAGFGKSDIPTTPFSVETQSQMVLNLCNFLEIKKFHILSHSYGGRISINLLAKEGGRISSALLVAPAGVKEKSVKRSAKIAIFKLRKKLTLQKNMHKLDKYYSTDYQNAEGVLKEMFQMAISFDQTSQLGKITTKVLILRGNNDSAISKKQVKTMEKRMKNAVLCEIDGDHFVFLRCGVQFQMIAENFFMQS